MDICPDFSEHKFTVLPFQLRCDSCLYAYVCNYGVQVPGQSFQISNLNELHLTILFFLLNSDLSSGPLSCGCLRINHLAAVKYLLGGKASVTHWRQNWNNG